MTPKEIIAALDGGRKANRHDQYREGNLIKLQPPGAVIMTGDLHGNERNFERLLNYAQLHKHPKRHLILHELLHSSDISSADQCHSYGLLARAAQFKAEFPDQIHILLGNHALAQVTHDEVLKNGQAMVKAVHTALQARYGDDAARMIHAMDQFILSLPLAARTENRIWLSHSLPSMRHLADWNGSIFEKELSLDDMKNDASLHALTWDRSHSDKCLAKLRQLWEVDMFVIGHQPQAVGRARPHERVIILASDHGHGCFLPFDLEQRYSPDELFGQVKALASLA